MLDDFSLKAIVAYAEAHPGGGGGIAGGLLHKFIKVAVVCAIVLLIGLYGTQRDNSDWWERAAAVGSEVVGWGEALVEKADEIFEKGKQQLKGN